MHLAAPCTRLTARDCERASVQALPSTCCLLRRAEWLRLRYVVVSPQHPAWVVPAVLAAEANVGIHTCVRGGCAVAMASEGRMEFLAEESICGHALLRLVARGSSIIAEMQRLSSHLPLVFLNPTHPQQVRSAEFAGMPSVVRVSGWGTVVT